MPYLIQLKDKPDSFDLRMKVRAEHLAYLDAHKAKLLAAGALIDDDGSGGFGGAIIYDSDDRSEAESFIHNDPFHKAGLFSEVVLTRWRKAFFDGKNLVG